MISRDFQLIPTTRACVCGLLLAALAGCNAVPMYQFQQSQLQTLSLYRQNQSLAGQLAGASQTAEQLAMEKQQLEQITGQMHGELQAAQQQLQLSNERLANLGSERQDLHSRYSNLLASLQSGENPLSGSANRRFEELARKYPEFQFDPYTGVSKFTGDLLFATGSAELRTDASPLLQEFAQIMNDPDARPFNILVVGHTDDQPIKKASTKAKHGSNWELSAHRATAVVGALSKLGLAEHRMGIAGYSKFQPVAANADDSGRQRNRRVEIFILANDAKIADAWDAGNRF
jgi:chemotaxis protein MotB